MFQRCVRVCVWVCVGVGMGVHLTMIPGRNVWMCMRVRMCECACKYVRVCSRVRVCASVANVFQRSCQCLPIIANF